MYQPIASVYFRSVAASSFLFHFILLSSQTFINRSVQNTFKFAFYTNHTRLILLRQIFKVSFWKLRWSWRFSNTSSANIFGISAYPVSIDLLCPHEKCKVDKYFKFVFKSLPAQTTFRSQVWECSIQLSIGFEKKKKIFSQKFPPPLPPKQASYQKKKILDDNLRDQTLWETRWLPICEVRGLGPKFWPPFCWVTRGIRLRSSRSSPVRV